MMPSFDYAAGSLELDDPRLGVGATVFVGGAAADYAQMRLPPRELVTPEYMPEGAALAVSLSLGQPSETYERLVEALDPRIKKLTGTSLKVLIRRFERRGARLYIDSRIVPILSGEIGVFVMQGEGLPAAGIVIPVNDRRAAESEIPKLLAKMLGSPPKIDLGLAALPVAHGMVEDSFVISAGEAGLAAVRRAVKSGKTLAASKAFRSATAGLPAQSTLLVVAQEPDEQQKRRHASEPLYGAACVSMGKTELSLSLSVPNLAQLIMSGAPAAPPVREPARGGRWAPAEDALQGGHSQLA
jgi:hypothetical protein